MPFLTKQQQIEQTTLHQAMRTITKVAPLKWTTAVQMRVLEKQKQGLSISQIVQDLDLYLQRHSVGTWVQDNSFRGGHDRSVYLSDGQREKIVWWINLMLRTGGRFSDFEEE